MAMTEKIVSQLDAAGYFVAGVVADESPLEPGVFLLPGGSIDVAPPTIPEGKVALWQGESWAFVNPPATLPDQDPPIHGVPQVVTMRQARLALLSAGLLAAVESVIDALESPQKETARIVWEYAQEVRRTDPLVQMLAPALNLSEEAIDSLFTVAAGL
jgi:hypothetical protein